MKAVQITKYGKDALEINRNIPNPSPQKGQILVEVHAASINPFDLKLILGAYKNRIPLTFPFRPGGDFAGVVKTIGDGVVDFQIGDEVYGQALVLNGGSGSFAEMVAANTNNTALKPKTASFVEAAALPLAGVSAVQALEEHIRLEKNQKILIHGGAGGIGHIAIQIAKALDAYVATTVNTDDVAYVKKLGADRVIDYKTQSFETILKNYDAVFDTVGGEVTTKSFIVLKNRGALVSMLGKPDHELAKAKDITTIGQSTNTNTKHLNRLANLVDAGKIKVSVDKVYSLEQIREAANHQETHPRGKLVLKIRK